MAETLPNAVPWSQGNHEETAGAETTPGGAARTPWVVVAANLNPAEAAIIKGRLESEGIAALARQEAVGIVLGLTVGPLGSAQVWVPEPQAKQALALLADTFEAGEADKGA
ncbi:MAG: DUF2007 domain-containing protein [Anaerolineae bacterium]|nr:DUF2007 domain-containing protein [Anaerolineae bacterium]